MWARACDSSRLRARWASASTRCISSVTSFVTFAKPRGVPSGRAEGGDRDVGEEPRPVLAHAPALAAELALAGRAVEARVDARARGALGVEDATRAGRGPRPRRSPSAARPRRSTTRSGPRCRGGRSRTPGPTPRAGGRAARLRGRAGPRRPAMLCRRCTSSNVAHPPARRGSSRTIATCGRGPSDVNVLRAYGRIELMSRIGVAVVGAGFMGGVHSEALRRAGARSWASWESRRRRRRSSPTRWARRATARSGTCSPTPPSRPCTWRPRTSCTSRWRRPSSRQASTCSSRSRSR